MGLFPLASVGLGGGWGRADDPVPREGRLWVDRRLSGQARTQNSGLLTPGPGLFSKFTPINDEDFSNPSTSRWSL